MSYLKLIAGKIEPQPNAIVQSGIFQIVKLKNPKIQAYSFC